jgi:8-oxo-dGTP pyrophosphatase MutT (NUDIX family)
MFTVRKSPAQGDYSVVAGHIEPGETPRHAMRREASEEIGIDLDEDDLDFAHVMYRRKPNETTRVDVFFACTRWTGDRSPEPPHRPRRQQESKTHESGEDTRQSGGVRRRQTMDGGIVPRIVEPYEAESISARADKGTRTRQLSR